jgi:pre-mRNA-splicing factor CDC5/CEF1
MPLVVKGGKWRNTEDEILKAAVSKYGMNQWARISSLLVRRTPKQCKARWYEWLDPSIKKTEWSKEEDEKLLHLAKLMPTQWRTIAQVVGRTATQCLEQYQKLLDEAEAREHGEVGFGGPGDEAAAPTADDVRRLRPGEIDPDPETRRALPDPIDMDEDEKEMLSEARARLANTQGKKAKRKARERQLDCSHRLAKLQKRRELKAAGINARLEFRKRGDMDYNADIPFEIKPQAGFYDTTEEEVRGRKEAGMIDISKIQASKRQIQEADEHRRKRRRTAVIQPQDDEKVTAQRTRQLQRLKQAEQLTRRRPLNLPTPQVGDSELEEIVKLGMTGESVRSLVDESGNYASRGLLNDYSRMETTAPMRTPMTQTQSSLLGGENTPQNESGGTCFGSLPEGNAVAPLATPLRMVNGSAPPHLGATPLRTPRDTLALKQTYGVDQEKATILKLRHGFASLPKPKNDFELVLPDDLSEDELEEELSAEDAEERDRRLRQTEQAEEQAAQGRRSQVLQRNLPRPKHVDFNHLLAVAKESNPIQRIVAEEMARLVLYEASLYPLHDIVPPAPIEFTEFSADEMGRACDEVRQELPTSIIGFDEETWAEFDDTNIDEIPSSAVEDKLIKSAPTGKKLETNLTLTLSGYQSRHSILVKKVKDVTEAIEQARIDLKVYQALQNGERVTAPLRVASLVDEVEILERQEREGQRRFKELDDVRGELRLPKNGVIGH